MWRIEMNAAALFASLAILIAPAVPSNAAAEAGRVSTIPGDTNGNGQCDLGDAIYLLNHLFINGPDPAVCLTIQPVTLPATGQVKCYDDAWLANEIDCARWDYPGQDGFYQLGCPMKDRFTDNGDGTVTDNCAGLMWEKYTLDVNEDGTVMEDDVLPWQDALKYCDSLTLADYDDWRLPNIRELLSIVDFGRSNSAIDPVFPGLGVHFKYWSSSAGLTGATPLWNVNFVDGDSRGIVPADYHVRAVRGGLSSVPAMNAAASGHQFSGIPGDINADGQCDLGDAICLLDYLFADGPDPATCPPAGFDGVIATGQKICRDERRTIIDCASPDYPGQDGFYQAGCPTEGRFIDNGDGTVTDNCTGLMWMQSDADINKDGIITSDDKLIWKDALTYCSLLWFAGYDDWRLPNIRELESLVDYSRRMPAIDPMFHVWIGGLRYWSSTSSHSWPFDAWIGSFLNGTITHWTVTR